MAIKRRWAFVALLIAAPAVAAAQQQQGDPRSPDYLSRAKTLVGKKRYKAALALFDSLTRAQPGSRDAALGRAQMLAWIGRFADAVRAYERWLEAHPKDVEAAELLGQALVWVGRLDDAERVYKVLAALGSHSAERGLARIAARRGDLPESERRWRAIVAKRPNDSEAWVGLAQVLRWTNRPRQARTALARAVQADPANRDAAEQLKWVEASLAPRVEPTVTSLDDTDGNRLVTTGATAAVAAPWDGELAARIQRRNASLGASRASSLTAELAASRATGRFAVRGMLGATRFDNGSGVPGAATRDVMTGAALASVTLHSRANVTLRAGREPFDETAPLMRRGIVTTSVSAGGVVDLTRRVSFLGEIERANLSGATANTRTGGSGSIRWRAPLALSLLATVRTFSYTSDPGEGYFAPRRYVLGEAGARLAIGRELGWGVTLDGGAGAQAIDVRNVGSETRPAARGSLGILYRPTPGLEWAATGQITNAASAATSNLTSYRTSGWTVRGKVSF